MDKMSLEIPTRFESERLVLRCYQAGDGPMYYAVGQKNREHLQRYEAENSVLSPRTVEEAETLVQEMSAEWAARRSFFLGAFDRGTGEFVAQIYVGVVNWDMPELMVGYFVDRDHQGRGFVTEAVKATLVFIFKHMNAWRVRLECDDTNVRSYRVAERCGFVREGHLRENRRHPDGAMSGTYYYGLLRSEYASARRLQQAASSALPRILSRPFRGEVDFWKVRRLLIETYPIAPPAFNWEIRRWDGWFSHRREMPFDSPRTQLIRLWETEDGQLVGVAHSEDGGDLHLELHPDYRHLEEEMIAWGEEQLAVPTQDGRYRRLVLVVPEYNAPRRRLLQKLGYEKLPESGMTRRMRLGNRPLPPVAMAAGYTLRTTRPGDEGDYLRMADMLNAGFDRTSHTAAEYRNFVTWSPSFCHDLNLVAEAPDGSFAAHVGLTYEETNRYGVFEPVCTRPAHRRKGLARSLMFEGLHRLKALGAAEVYVGTGDAIPANELYESVGFGEAYQDFTWRKVF